MTVDSEAVLTMSLSDDGEFASADEGEDVKKATASEKVANNANKGPVQKELDKVGV